MALGHLEAHVIEVLARELRRALVPTGCARWRIVREETAPLVGERVPGASGRSRMSCAVTKTALASTRFAWASTTLSSQCWAWVSACSKDLSTRLTVATAPCHVSVASLRAAMLDGGACVASLGTARFSPRLSTNPHAKAG